MSEIDSTSRRCRIIKRMSCVAGARPRGRWPNGPLDRARRRGDRIEMLFAAVHEPAFGTSRHFAALQNLSAFERADIEQPLLELCFRSFDPVVDDPSRFLKGLGWRWAWHRCGQPQPIFVVYRYDETGLASEIEPVGIVRLGFEDHSLRSHSALKRLVPKSGVLPPDTFF